MIVSGIVDELKNHGYADVFWNNNGGWSSTKATYGIGYSRAGRRNLAAHSGSVVMGDHPVASRKMVHVQITTQKPTLIFRVRSFEVSMKGDVRDT